LHFVIDEVQSRHVRQARGRLNDGVGRVRVDLQADPVDAPLFKSLRLGFRVKRAARGMARSNFSLAPSIQGYVVQDDIANANQDERVGRKQTLNSMFYVRHSIDR